MAPQYEDAAGLCQPAVAGLGGADGDAGEGKSRAQTQSPSGAPAWPVLLHLPRLPQDCSALPSPTEARATLTLPARRVLPMGVSKSPST